jgi:hypothetical protein
LRFSGNYVIPANLEVFKPCPQGAQPIATSKLTPAVASRMISWIYYRVYEELTMANTSQKRAIDNYRKRLQKRGMARFEVLGLGADRELIRSLAKRLADDSPESARIRAAVRQTISGEPNKGGILNALRRSPLVGAELNLERPVTADRKVDL